MKNNKYAPYILGVVLVLVWGLVFYKIYQAVYGGGDGNTLPSFQKMPVYKGSVKDSSFALLLDYKDPFLGKNFSGHNHSNTPRVFNNNSNTNKTPNKPVVAKQNSPVVVTVTKKPFPSIVYQGFQILDSDTIALLKIDGRFYPNARKGQYLNSVGIQGIYKDSVQLLFDGYQQTFSRRK